MAGDLQATLEISVEFSTFHNVDLFQRGYYQVRCSLKPPDKCVSCIDVEYRRNNGDYQPDDCLYPAMITPIGQTAISKTFQILYRNEDVILSDSFVFRLNLLVDSNKVTEQIDQADVQLLVELFFSDAEVGPEAPDSLVSVSSQVLKLHLSCVKGLHHHVPVLFDYFHFAVVDTTIHAMLVKISLPDPSILKMPKSSWFSKNNSNSRLSTPLFYAKLFGSKPLSNVLNSRTPAEERQIRFAYDTHRSLCSTLLSAQVNLLAYFECLSEYLPTSQQIQIGSLDFGDRLDSLMKTIESIQNPNEVFSQICSDLENVSMEVSLVWSQFLESFTLNKKVMPHFRNEHHRQRIGHFSEAFFLQEYSWDELQIHQEQSFQMHQSLGQGIKNSRYYQTIPTVMVECPCLDGDVSSTPIIFEDKYTFNTPEQGALSGKDDLEESENIVDDELVILETDFTDTPASQDDPNSSFALSGVLCDGGRPVRETMILDDDLDSDLTRLLDDIQSSKLSPCSPKERQSKLDNDKEKKESCTSPEGSGASGTSNTNEQNINSLSDVLSAAGLSDDAKEDEAFLMDLSLQKALLEQFERQKSNDSSEDKTEQERALEDRTFSSKSLQCSEHEYNENKGVEVAKLGIAIGNELDHEHPTIEHESSIPTPGNQTGLDSNEVQISLKEVEQDEKETHETTSNENEHSEQGCNVAQIEEDKNDKEIVQESECLENIGTLESLPQDPSSDDSVGVITPAQEVVHSDDQPQSISSLVTTNSDSGTGSLEDGDSCSVNNKDSAPSSVGLESVPSGSEPQPDEALLSDSVENIQKPNAKDELAEVPSSDVSENAQSSEAKDELGDLPSSDVTENAQSSGAKDELGDLPSSDVSENAQSSEAKEELGDLPSSDVSENTQNLNVTDELCEPLFDNGENTKEESSEPLSFHTSVYPKEELDVKDENPNPEETVALLDTAATPSANVPALHDSNSETFAGDVSELDQKVLEGNSSDLNQPPNDATLTSSQVPEEASIGDYNAVATPLNQGDGDVINPSSSNVTFLSSNETTSNDASVTGSYQDGSHGDGATIIDGSKTVHPPKQQQDKQEKAKKGKKKQPAKGLGITGCLPVSTCTGNSSPTFTRGGSTYGGSVKSRFELAKRFVKRQLKFSCQIYSDIGVDVEREAYFTRGRPDSVETHLIICVHGLDGNSGDLRLFRCYLELALPSTRVDFLMSEVNQGDTFVSFEELTDRLVQEIRHFIDAYSIFPSKISFVGHSLGNIIIRSALTHPDMRPLMDRMYTLLSLSGPHVGMLYPTSPLVSTGLWLMQKWKKSEALTQLSLNDHENLRETFIYRLSQSKGFEYFKNVLLVSSVQDHYVPYHSARIEMCKAAAKDTSEYGTMYREMICNLLSPLKDKKNMTFIRYSCYHALASSANSFIGRAAHIAMLDSELFIEKLLLVSALDYFR